MHNRLSKILNGDSFLIYQGLTHTYLVLFILENAIILTGVVKNQNPRGQRRIILAFIQQRNVRQA